MLLTTLRTQQFLDGTPLSLRRWTAACRRQEDLMFIPISCRECQVPRALAMRTVLASPPKLPSFTCRALGLQCAEPLPRMLYQVPITAWQHSHSEKHRPVSRAISIVPTYGLPEELLAASPAKGMSRTPSISPQTIGPPPTTVHRAPLPQTTHSPSILSVSTNPDKPRFTWSQLETQRRHWDDDIRRNDDAGLNPYGCVLPQPSYYIVGDPLTRFRNPDPDSTAISEYLQIEKDGTWKIMRKDFFKWLAAQQKDAYFEGKQDIAPVIE